MYPTGPGLLPGESNSADTTLPGPAVAQGMHPGRLKGLASRDKSKGGRTWFVTFVCA